MSDKERVKNLETLIEKCVEVLREHIPPNGITNLEAIGKFYDLLDGKEFCKLMPDLCSPCGPENKKESIY